MMNEEQLEWKGLEECVGRSEFWTNDAPPESRARKVYTADEVREMFSRSDRFTKTISEKWVAWNGRNAFYGERGGGHYVACDSEGLVTHTVI